MLINDGCLARLSQSGWRQMKIRVVTLEVPGIEIVQHYPYAVDGKGK